MAKILVVDDEPKVCSLLKDLFIRGGHEISSAGTIESGLSLAGEHSFDLVFLDVRLPDGNGLSAIPGFSGSPGTPEIVIMTGFGDPDGAELAISSGAWDYLQKPPSISQFLFTFEKAMKYREQKQVQKQVIRLDRTGLVGESEPMKRCYELLAEAAVSDASVVFTGETGTGKEIFAAVLHRNSRRANGPFIALDCAGLSKHLIESTLFGYRKGAFTGADKSTAGVVRQADKGSLFLDEIGELPLEMQKSLLRVLQEKNYRPLGAVREEASDFRLMAATNQDLSLMVAKGLFREDLFFRLNAFQVKLPPLRERKEDIRDIITHHLKKRCDCYHVPAKGVSQDFFMVLEAYDWPGNVRELLNVLETALAKAATEPNLFSKHLPMALRAKVARDGVKDIPLDRLSPEISGLNSIADSSLPSFREFRDQIVEDAERAYLLRLTSASGNDFQRAIEMSGLGKTRLYHLLKKHDISVKG
ncbi:MAG: sigma-54 dependent transcriptional regulator [Pseudomonadota bacterium]